MAATFASVALGMILAAAQAATAPSTAPAAELAALVAKLAADDVAERDAAQQAILDFPADPTDALRAARPGAADPDVRMRIDALLVQGRERFELGASRVTLRFSDAPLDQVIDALATQSRARFNDLANDFGDERPRVTIDVRDATFWEAIAQLQQSANIVFQPGGGPDGGWRVSRNFGQGGNALRGVEAGAFFVQPVSAHYSRSVGYARNAGSNESFSVQVMLLAEPKIRLSEQSATLTLERARDDRGNDLMPPGGRGQMMGGGVGQGQVNFGVQLAYPKQPGDTIAELAGVARLAIANRSATIESDDLIGGGKLERVVEGVRVSIVPTLAKPRNNGGPEQARLELAVTLDRAGDAALADRIQRALQRARVTDPEGRAMQFAGINNSRNDGTTMELRMSFQQLRVPRPAADGAQQPSGSYGLHAEVPIGFRSIEVPFTLRDLKMP